MTQPDADVVLDIEEDFSTKEILGRSPRQIAWMRFRRNKVGMAAAGVSALILLMSIFAPVITALWGLDPDELNLNVLNKIGVPKLPWGGAGWDHPLGLSPGTGRDLFAQLLYGSRISFTVAFLSTFLTLFVGLVLGIVGGYFKGRVDGVLGRITDFLMAFPAFFMLVALADPVVDRIESLGVFSGNGARMAFLILFFAFFGWTGFARLIRSQVLSIRERDFITAAQSMGASSSRIIFKEIMPNLWAPVIVVVSLSLPGYLSAEAAFSFLGLGIQPPASTWGILLAISQRFVSAYPQFFLVTAGSLVLVVLAFNLVGDAVRDALDPRTDR